MSFWTVKGLCLTLLLGDRACVLWGLMDHEVWCRTQTGDGAELRDKFHGCHVGVFSCGPPIVRKIPSENVCNPRCLSFPSPPASHPPPPLLAHDENPDNLFLEWTLALQLQRLGIVSAIHPIFIGEIDEKNGSMESLFGSPALTSLPDCVSGVAVRLVDVSAKWHAHSQHRCRRTF